MYEHMWGYGEVVIVNYSVLEAYRHRLRSINIAILIGEQKEAETVASDAVALDITVLRL